MEGAGLSDEDGKPLRVKKADKVSEHSNNSLVNVDKNKKKNDKLNRSFELPYRIKMQEEKEKKLKSKVIERLKKF